MFYVIQENTFNEKNYSKLLDAIRKMDLPFEVVRCYHFIDKIVKLSDIPENIDEFDLDKTKNFNPKEKNIFVFGTFKLSKIARKRGWKPGSLLNENYDFISYRKLYKENLLNFESKISTVGADINFDGQMKFIRPTEDSKSFNGKLYSESDWEFLKNYNIKNFKSSFNNSTLIQINNPKTIFKEIRFWIVNGKPVTASVYKEGKNVIYKEYFDEEGFEFVKKMLEIHQLSKAFVMDICLTPDGWKIVECGDISSAGYYDADMQKIIMALENTF